MPLILRSVKGSNLTANEVDGNFTYLSSSIDNITSGSITVTSASYALSASTAATASLAPAYLPLTGGTISGNLVVNGTGSFNYVVSTYESSSIIYSSGSTKFGDSQDDTHVFTGSVSISGSSLTLNDNAVVMSSQTSSMSVATASYVATAQTASYVNLAQTASYVVTALTASYVDGVNVAGVVANATSASHAGESLTANVASTASYMSGSTVVTTTIITATGSLHLAATDGVITIGISPSSSNVIIGKVDTQTTIYGTLINATSSLTGSLLGTSSYALEALTSSYATQALTSSYTTNAETLDGLDSSVFVQTGSFNSFTSSYNTDSSSFSTRTSALETASGSFSSRITNTESTSSELTTASGSFSTRVTDLESASGSFSTRTTTLENASGSFSTRTTNLEAFTSSYSTTGSNTFYGNQTIVGGGSGYASYITTSVNDATLGLDSSAAINALYFLKSGTKKFEVSFDTTNANGIFRLLPYTGSSFFEIGNPSNAGTDYVFISEPTYGNVLLGPGLSNGDGAVDGATPSIHKVQIKGGMFVSGSITATSFIGNLQGTAATASVAPYYLLTASYNSDSSSFSTRITNNESTGSTLTLASGSFSTRTTDLETASGSFSTRVTDLETASGSFSTRVALTETTSSKLDAASGSLSTRVTATEATASNLEAASGSFSTRTTTLETASGSLSTRVTATETTASNLVGASSSFSSRVTVVEGNYATTGSNTFTGTQYTSNTTNATGFTSTAALYTDGGMRVSKDAYVSGTIYVNNLTVYGTQSVQYITSSEFLISDNIINLNAGSPVARFGGIAVYDSGSTGLTGSFLWDSQNNKWIYSNPSGAAYDGGMAIFGPRNTTGLGNEQGTTNNALMKGQGGDHITSSNITDDGSKVSIPYGVDVTGSLTATTLVGSLNGSNLVDASVSNAKLANSAITIAGNSTSLGSSISAATILSGTGVFSGSAQITGLTNSNLSGTAGITNANLANSAITIAGSSTSLGGSISAATIGNAIGAFSGSAQVDHNSTTNYVANQHIDHTTVSISAGSGLSGGGTIASTRTLTLDTGSTHFVNGARASISVSDTTGASGIDLTYSAGVLSGTLANSAVTVTAGSGLSGGGSVSLGGSVTLSNAGVTSITAGTGISRDVSTGGVTITNTGVTSNVAGTGISVSGATGAVTITNSGVTSITAGSGISVNTSTGGVTITNTITNNNQLSNGAGYITSAGTAANASSISSATGGSYTWTATNYFQSNLGTTLGSLSSPPLQAYSTSTNSAFMSFHRGGSYAINMGLDSDNVFRIGGWSASANRLQMDMSGNLTMAGDITAYSDARVKENVKTIDNALDKVLALRGVYYNRIDSDDKKRKMGVIAQETLPIVPEVVNQDSEGMYNVSYGNLGGLFIEAFKNQQTLIHSQQSQIDELKELVNQLLNK
jgi:hypothetical protein